jgi:hypothetical protein
MRRLAEIVAQLAAEYEARPEPDALKLWVGILLPHRMEVE